MMDLLLMTSLSLVPWLAAVLGLTAAVAVVAYARDVKLRPQLGSLSSAPDAAAPRVNCSIRESSS